MTALAIAIGIVVVSLLLATSGLVATAGCIRGIGCASADERGLRLDDRRGPILVDAR